jgi:hypothetical protein
MPLSLQQSPISWKYHFAPASHEVPSPPRFLILNSRPLGTVVWHGNTKNRLIGRPIKGADVRIEAKNFSKILKTDASGHYVTDGLAVGTYKVTLVINGQVKALILDAKTQVGKATQRNFNLTGKMAAAKKHAQMVWIPSDINTRIGGGRWVEVDDNGNIVDNTGFNNVEKVRRPAVYGKDIMDIRVSLRP